jgi:hypothetical protein
MRSERNLIAKLPIYYEVNCMPRRQGNYMSEQEIRRIKSLLANTDMSLDAIADRMKRSKSAINAVNRKFNIRQYHGGRSTWIVRRCG